MINYNSNHSEAGFTLVELIVSVTITAIIMVGVSAFFASSFHNIFITQEKLDQSQGQFNTNNIIRDKLTGIKRVVEPVTLSGQSEVVVENETEDGDLPFTYIANVDNKLVFKDFFVFNGMFEDEDSMDFDVVNPGGVTEFDSDFYVTAPLENKIYKCIAYNSCNEFVTSKELNHPTDITTDDLNYLYVSDSGNDQVIMIDASGDVTEFPFKLNFPTGVAFSNGSLYISDTYNNRVVRIYNDVGSKMAVVTGEETSDACDNTAKLCKLNFPTGLVVSGDGKSLYISDTGSGRILKITDPIEAADLINHVVNLGSYGMTKISKIVFDFASVTDTSLITENSNTLRSCPSCVPRSLGKYSASGSKLNYYLSVPLVKGDATFQDCDCVAGDAPCPIYFQRFTVAEENHIFTNDEILIDGYEYNIVDVDPAWSGIQVDIPECNGDEFSHAPGTIVTINNNFDLDGSKEFDFDISASGISPGFNLITTEIYDSAGDIVESATTKQILRVGDGIIGTYEDEIEVAVDTLDYPTGLGWDSELKTTGLPVYSTNFAEYDYESNFDLATDGLGFSTPNPNILQMDIETGNGDTYVINAAL